MVLWQQQKVLRYDDYIRRRPVIIPEAVVVVVALPAPDPTPICMTSPNGAIHRLIDILSSDVALLERLGWRRESAL